MSRRFRGGARILLRPRLATRERERCSAQARRADAGNTRTLSGALSAASRARLSSSNAQCSVFTFERSCGNYEPRARILRLATDQMATRLAHNIPPIILERQPCSASATYDSRVQSTEHSSRSGAAPQLLGCFRISRIMKVDQLRIVLRGVRSS